MFHEPIVKDRVKTALKEGITSQSVAQARRDHSGSDSFLSRLLHSIARIWNKEPKQTWGTEENSISFQQSEETGS